ncbi:MAG: TlpA disulfide reductase family protein [Pedobacter sp.]
MKRLSVILLLISATLLNAQTLHLKKKQQFKYETLDFSKYEPNVPSSNLNYNVINFEVLKASKGQYLLKVTEPTILSVSNGKLSDSKLPMQEQNKTFEAVAAKVLSTSPLFLTIDKQYNVLGIAGMDQLRAKIATALEEQKIPDGDQPNKFLLEHSYSDAKFIRKLKRIFPKGDALNLDSAYVGKGKTKTGSSKNDGDIVWVDHETLDSNMTSTNMGKEKKTGLLMNYRQDYVSQTLLLDTKKLSFSANSDAINLVSSNINNLGFDNLLFEEFDKIFHYKEYYTPEQIAVRHLAGLSDKLQNQKGKLGVADEVKRQVDSLDRLFSDDNLNYWAARLNLAGLIGDRSYGDLYEKVPYDALTRDYHVMMKARREYQAGNSNNLNYAIELLFRKFSRMSEQGYPLNMHIIEGLLHNDLAKDVLQTNNIETLRKKLKLIEDTELLKNPKVDKMFLALKTYTRARLASTPDEIIPLTKISFDGLSNRKGRYRILIYDELVRAKVADSVRNAYLDYSIEQFKNTLAALAKGEDRVLTRKYLADAYYRKSLLDSKGSISYLSLAGDYMPDQQDKLDANYTLEPEYVFLPAKDYNQMLMSSSGSSLLTPEQKLYKMIDLLIIEPERYEQIKVDYVKAYPKGDFKMFLSKALKSKLPSTPAFLLKETSGRSVSSKVFEQPFTFIDFWGTWCLACVDEIHLVEALHANNPAPEKLKVTTIACYDKKYLVDDFMTKKKYGYQVLMSDGQVEHDFKVSHYPTKVLLLPNGVYLGIPSRSEYSTLITKYLDWEL